MGGQHVAFRENVLLLHRRRDGFALRQGLVVRQRDRRDAVGHRHLRVGAHQGLAAEKRQRQLFRLRIAGDYRDIRPVTADEDAGDARLGEAAHEGELLFLRRAIGIDEGGLHADLLQPQPDRLDQFARMDRAVVDEGEGLCLPVPDDDLDRLVGLRLRAGGEPEERPVLLQRILHEDARAHGERDRRHLRPGKGGQGARKPLRAEETDRRDGIRRQDRLAYRRAVALLAGLRYLHHRVAVRLRGKARAVAHLLAENGERPFGRRDHGEGEACRACGRGGEQGGAEQAGKESGSHSQSIGRDDALCKDRAGSVKEKYGRPVSGRTGKFGNGGYISRHFRHVSPV